MELTIVIGFGVFFLLVLLFAGVGIYRRKKCKQTEDNEDIVGHRSVGFLLSTISLTATMVCGVFVNRTVTDIYTKGFAHTYLPWTYALTLLIGGLVFARRMRTEEHATMVEPLQQRYGSIMGAFLSVFAIASDILWCAALLSLFASAASVLVEWNFYYIVVTVLSVVTLYTLTGGLHGVMYAHIMYIICLFVALWLVVPFSVLHQHVETISSTPQEWGGSIQTKYIGVWFDQALSLIFGGIPRQVYFQHVLASKSVPYAQVMSCASALGVVVVAIPPVVIGMTAKSTDWLSVVPVNTTSITDAGAIIDTENVFTMVIQHLAPYWVSIGGLGGLLATVMSSTDSALLSASSMLSYNFYKRLIRKTASCCEVAWMYRVCVLLCAFLAGTVACFGGPRLADWWLFSYDVVYVVLFPQLVCAVFLGFVNLQGSIMALIVALVLRLGGGDETIGLPVWIKYPYFDGNVQVFPFRTFAMLTSLVSLVLVSALVDWWRPTRKPPAQCPEEVRVLRMSYTDPNYNDTRGSLYDDVDT